MNKAMNLSQLWSIGITHLPLIIHTSIGAFTGKYSLEMVKDVEGTSKNRRRRNVPSISTLTLDSIDILVYDFSLTKTGHLRQTTNQDIKREVP